MKKALVIMMVVTTMILMSCSGTRQVTYEYETLGQKRFHKKEIRSREAEKYLGYRCQTFWNQLFHPQKKSKKNDKEVGFLPVPMF